MDIEESERYQLDLATAKERGYTEAEFRAIAMELITAPRDESGRSIDRSPAGPLTAYLRAIGRMGTDYKEFEIGSA